MAHPNRTESVKLTRNKKKKKHCYFCINSLDHLSYRDSKITNGYYTTDRGKIQSRSNIGTCARHQRLIARAIKQARTMCLVPNIIR